MVGLSIRLLTGVVLVVVGCAPAPPTSDADVGVRPLEAGRFVLDSSEAPPSEDDPRWSPVTLPDRWDVRRPGIGGKAWYRFEVPGPAAPDARLALSLAGVNMNAEAFVNGVPIGSGGSLHEPVARNANRPLYFPFAGALLDRGVNRVDVRLHAYANDVGSLGRATLGDDAALRTDYRRRHLLQVELTQATSALVLLLALFFGVLWLGAARDPVYGWFALASGAWTFVSLNYWVQEPGLAHWTWVRLFYLALGTFSASLPIAVHRLFGLERPRVERVVFAVLAAYALLALALPDAAYPRIVTPFQALWLAGGTYGVALLVWGWRRFSRFEAVVYGLGGIFCTGLAIAEQLDAWGFGAGSRPHLMPYIGSVLVLCLATTLGVRFADSLRAARRANRELEARVAAKTRELETNHARLRELERGRVLADERARLVREMHDGLGGQLVATLALVQSEEGTSDEVARALRDALDDMRAVIDSMDPLVDDLGRLFGTLRARFDALLRRNDLRFAWRVGDVPPTPWLGPEQYLHILRILQEAVTNAIKHAKPTEIELSVERVDAPAPALRIAVRDDGVGSPPEAGSGRGLSHMRTRARALGARLAFVPLDPGTRVELWLPLEAKPDDVGESHAKGEDA